MSPPLDDTGRPSPTGPMTTDPRPLRRLRASYLIALALIAVMTLVSHSVETAMIAQQRSDATVINIAGRQRMLSQRMSKAAVALASLTDELRSHAAYRAELEAAHHLWVQSHDALQNGDPALGLQPLSDPGLLRAYTKLDRPFTLMDDAVRGILATDAADGSDAAALDAGVSQLLAHQAPFLTQQNDIVNAFENSAKAKVDRLERTQWWLLIATLIALVAEALLVFEPARRAMRPADRAAGRSQRNHVVAGPPRHPDRTAQSRHPHAGTRSLRGRPESRRHQALRRLLHGFRRFQSD